MVSVGVRGFESLVRDGIPKGSAVVIQGPPGNEKEIFGLEFVAEGLARGEGVVVVLSKISPEEYRTKLRKLGVEVDRFEVSGSLVFVDWYSHKSERIDSVKEVGSVFKSSQSLISLEIAISEALKSISIFLEKRAVLDLLSPSLVLFGSESVYGLSQTLRNKLRKAEVTSLFLIEKGMHEPDVVASIYQIFDGVIDIDRALVRGKLEWRLGIVFMRDATASSGYEKFSVRDGRLVLDSAAIDEISSDLMRYVNPIFRSRIKKKYAAQVSKQDELLKANPRNVSVWLARGFTFTEQGMFEDALRCYEAVLLIEPENDNAWSAKANVLKNLKRFQEAAKAFKRTLVLASAAADDGYPALFSEELSVEALIEHLKKDSAKFRDLHELDVLDAFVKRRPTTIEGWFEKGTKLFENGLLAESMDAFNEVTKREPANQQVWLMKGRVFEALGDREKAQMCFARAEDLQKRNGRSADAAAVRAGQPKPSRPREVVELQEGRVSVPPDSGGLARVPSAQRGTVSGTRPPVGSEQVGFTNLPARARDHAAGMTNGLTNGPREVGPGFTNGLREARAGLTNGLTNGMRETRSGLTNGLTNGIRETRSGLTNGLTNGNGMTNGLGSPRFSGEARTNRWKLFVIPVVAFALVAAPFLFTVEESVRYGINIDGDFTDWDGRTTPAVQRQSLNPGIDIVSAGIESDPDRLSFFVETRGPILRGGKGIVDTFHIFIDTDLSKDTGYEVGQLGADHMLTVYGKDGVPLRSFVSKFDTSRNSTDWNGWFSILDIRSAAKGFKLEAQLDWDALGIEPTKIAALFYAQSYDRQEDVADYVIASEGGVLLVLQESLVPETIQGADNRLLSLKLEAFVDEVELSEVAVQLVGTASVQEVSSLRLYSQQRGALMTKSPSSKNVVFSLAQPFILGMGEADELIVFADVSGSSGNTLGARLEGPESVKLARGIVSISELSAQRGTAYIGAVPAGAVIDGAFSDWSAPTIDDDLVQVENPNIDIEGYDALNSSGDLYFYLDVKGRVLNGLAVPNWNLVTGEQTNSPTIDSDSDGVPDDADPHPHDFNNDGIPDANANGDVDGDGLADYPAGIDQWLNTTIPQSFTEPYVGKEVHRFIGPVTEPPQTGEDTLRLYIDTSRGDPNGYSVRDIYADYMVQVLGRDGKVLKSELYRHPHGASPGNGNAWELMGTIDCANDYSRFEGMAALGMPLNASDAQLAFEMTDARQVTDEATAELSELVKSVGGEGPRSSDRVLPMFTPPVTNSFLVTGTGGVMIDSNNKKVSYRITINPNIGSLTLYGLWVYVFYAAGSSKTFRTGIQANSGGNPSGTFLCSFTFTGAAGWQSGTALSCGSFSGGTIIHAVTEYDSGGGNWGTNYISMLYTTPWNQLRPYDVSTDSNSNTLSYDGASWTVNNLQPVVIVNETSANGGDEDGNPYYTYSTGSITNAAGRGNKFQVSTATTMNRAQFFVSRWLTASNDLVMKIRSITDGTDMVSTSIPATDVGIGTGCNNGAWETFNFPIQTFVTGKTYAIWLETTGTSTFYTCVSITDNAAPFNLLTFDATTTFRTDVTPGSPPTFSDTNYHDVPFTIVPEFEDASIPIAVVLLIPVALIRGSKRRSRAPSAEEVR